MIKKIFGLIPMIAAIVILTIAAVPLIMFSFKTKKFPVTVSVEMKSQTDNIGQVFYSETTDFNEIYSVSKEYSGGDSFEEITFQLPHALVNYLRFDPGTKPCSFEIKKIKIQVGNQIKEFGGEELKANFSFVNLRLPDSSSSENIVLNSINNHDSQILFIHPLNQEFDLIESKRPPTTTFIITALYLILIIVVLKWRKRLTDSLINSKDRLCPTLWLVKVQIKPLWVAIVALICAKLFLVSVQQMTGITNSIHDDALFVKLAYNISSGNWLGNYDNLTLVKGFFYPFFIAITNALGMSLFFAQNMLYALASLLMVLALTPVIKSHIARISLFGLLLFNPMASVYYLTRVLREDIYTSLSMITLAAFIGIFLAGYKADLRKVKRWAILGGLSLFAFWNTREEGIVLLPAFLLLALLFLVMRYLMFRKHRKDGYINSWVFNPKKSIFYALLPFIMLLLGNFVVASANYYYYGAFVINEMKSRSFSDAFAALSKIKQEKFIINVPVSRATRSKGYAVSPAFAQLENYFESERKPWVQFGYGSPEEIKGGWTVWALRDAAAFNGYHSSLPESQKFYRQIANEINAAFQDGRLEKTSNISLFGFTWDQRFFKPFVKIFTQQLRFVTGFEGYDPYPRAQNDINTAEGISRFQNMTNEIVCTQDMVNAKLPGPAKMKYKLLLLVGKIYQLFNPIIAVISIFCFVLIFILLLKNRKQQQLFDLVIILSLLFYIVFSRHALIASGTVAQWTVVQPHYLNLIYSIMLLFQFLAIWGVWNYISTPRKQRSNSISKNTN
jgi:hypothetical protein